MLPGANYKSAPGRALCMVTLGNRKNVKRKNVKCFDDFHFHPIYLNAIYFLYMLLEAENNLNSISTFIVTNPKFMTDHKRIQSNTVH